MPIRVAVVGCGAATRLYAAPALAELERRGLVRVTILFDPNPVATKAVQMVLPEALSATDLGAALEGAELALIASPPVLHAPQAIAALKQGLHVFCEKPMALGVAEAEAVISAAETAGRLVAIGLVRRYLPATGAIRVLLRGGALGRLRSIDWFEGGPFGWPVSSPGYFRREQSGGGVLQDVGTHALDLLNWWCGTVELLDYADDAMGGVEANARLRLLADGAEVRMRLSRDWERPNRVVIAGEIGSLEWEVNEPLRLELKLAGAPFAGPLSLDSASGAPEDFVAAYAAQLHDMTDAIRSGRSPMVPAAAGRDACALVEACYRARRPLEMAWFSVAERARAAALAGAGP